MKLRWFAAAALVAMTFGGLARGEEQPVAIKNAPGHDVVENNCASCHSLDYIRTNAPLPAKTWEAEVTKMINAFGAPIDPADAKPIVDYLKNNYAGG